MVKGFVPFQNSIKKDIVMTTMDIAMLVIIVIVAVVGVSWFIYEARK